MESHLPRAYHLMRYKTKTNNTLFSKDGNVQNIYSTGEERRRVGHNVLLSQNAVPM